MNPKMTVMCKRCGGEAQAEVSPEAFDDNPTTFVLTLTCKANCPPTSRTLTVRQVRDLTQQSYDGVTGRWEKLLRTH